MTHDAHHSPTLRQFKKIGRKSFLDRTRCWSGRSLIGELHHGGDQASDASSELGQRGRLGVTGSQDAPLGPVDENLLGAEVEATLSIGPGAEGG